MRAAQDRGHDPDLLPCSSAPDLFFADLPTDVEHAKALCADCAVRELCLAGALARREEAGVWGGQLIVRGRVVAFKRSPGRPRKSTEPHVA